MLGPRTERSASSLSASCPPSGSCSTFIPRYRACFDCKNRKYYFALKIWGIWMSKSFSLWQHMFSQQTNRIRFSHRDGIWLWSRLPGQDGISRYLTFILVTGTGRDSKIVSNRVTTTFCALFHLSKPLHSPSSFLNNVSCWPLLYLISIGQWSPAKKWKNCEPFLLRAIPYLSSSHVF